MGKKRNLFLSFSEGTPISEMPQCADALDRVYVRQVLMDKDWSYNPMPNGPVNYNFSADDVKYVQENLYTPLHEHKTMGKRFLNLDDKRQRTVWTDYLPKEDIFTLLAGHYSVRLSDNDLSHSLSFKRRKTKVIDGAGIRRSIERLGEIRREVGKAAA